MAATATRPRYWTCAGCGYRNERAHVKCRGESCNRTRPKKRVPVHARVLRDVNYDTWEMLSVQIHGGDAGACALCKKPRPDTYRHERDHGHKKHEHAFGKARGVLCTYCNKERVGHLSLDEARAVVEYLERVERFYAGEAV